MSTRTFSPGTHYLSDIYYSINKGEYPMWYQYRLCVLRDSYHESITEIIDLIIDKKIALNTIILLENYLQEHHYKTSESITILSFSQYELLKDIPCDWINDKRILKINLLNLLD